MTKELTCIECPKGCRITVELIGGEVKSVKGNDCPRGKKYAESEVICPMRVLTTTVRCSSGEMVSVKTDKPVRKAELFDLMKKINGKIVDAPVKTGQIIIENISDGVNLIATCGIE